MRLYSHHSPGRCTVNAIRTAHLTKHFKPISLAFWRRQPGGIVCALEDVSLDVEQGVVFGLLGPNGAGKSTLVKTLCTLLIPTRGSAIVNGFDISRQSGSVRASVGLVSGDERSFYWRLSARENLLFFANLQNLHGREAAARVDELLDVVKLGSQKTLPFKSLSTGMKQRISIARGLLHDPPIVFFDEPTKGLDVKARDDLHRFVREELIERKKKTAFITTHDMEEAANLCTSVAILSAGRVRNSGAVERLTRGVTLKTVYEEAISE